MNLSNESILITSAEVSLVDTNGKLKREGQRGAALSFLPQDNEPVLIAPGKKETISIRIGFQLEGLIPILDDMKLEQQPYFPPADEQGDVRRVHASMLVHYMNTYIKETYGSDASIEVKLYSGVKTKIHSRVFRLAEGGDLFDHSGNIDWSAFLGELAHIKQTWRKN
ncbi:hypothetical protein BIT28_25315 [Photobacterium proteolyticum]|uniref:Uncharacterized protein n=1 Tax=Photobacterium proteolyticum TaxID=1903952 RepID=A0A1Q9GFC3_9GAMM|nr:hypothetical protein [Photobacterium proteolyticum]OLQ73148.1 hypothetical protein BIT28_25315 [Photobacterium proteolyticum]